MMMKKAEDKSFDRETLRQSLLFWRGDSLPPPPPPPPQLPEPERNASVHEINTSYMLFSALSQYEPQNGHLDERCISVINKMQGQEYLKSQKKVLKQLDKKEDNGPHPWRYVRWRKAHENLVMPIKEKKESKENFYHKVLPDEDLFEIAEKYASYPEVLMEANCILNPVNVATGQILWVPRTHSIQWGNTLWSLSKKYNVPIHTIQSANGIADPDLIYAGDILVIPEVPDNRNAW